MSNLQSINHISFFFVEDKNKSEVLHYSDLEKVEDYEDSNFALIDLASYGDCTGGLVNKANLELLTEEFEFLVSVCGSYGYKSVGFFLQDLTVELIDNLKSLEDYPCLDEDKWSELELESQSEAWESWARYDFIKSLEKKYDLDLSDLDDDELIYQVFEEAREASNTYWYNEEGDNSYIDLKEVLPYVDLKKLTNIQLTLDL